MSRRRWSSMDPSAFGETSLELAATSRIGAVVTDLMAATAPRASVAGQAFRKPPSKSGLVAFVGPDRRRIEVTQARAQQALRALVAAGTAGITSLECSSWALRLGDYIHKLRRIYHLNIESQAEPHDIGDVCGNHSRYRLIDTVLIVEPGSAEARAA